VAGGRGCGKDSDNKEYKTGKKTEKNDNKAKRKKSRNYRTDFLIDWGLR